MKNGLLFVATVALSALQASAAQTLSFDRQSVLVDGKRTFLVSGEFH